LTILPDPARGGPDGSTLWLTKHGRPLAKLVPLRQRPSPWGIGDDPHRRQGSAVLHERGVGSWV